MDVAALLIGARFAVYATILAAFGIALFGDDRRGDAATDVTAPSGALLATLALTGAVASVAQILAMAASMAGVGISGLDRATLMDLIAASAIGYAWLLRIGALIAVALAALALRRFPKTMRATSFVGATIAVATLAWTGHGAMDDGAIGWFHLMADIVHLLAAGAWLGAIVSLLLLLRPGASGLGQVAHAHQALDRFAVTGTLLVALIIATGVANMWLLVGWSHLMSLGTADYGRLLLLKLALFSAMLGLAAANRFRLTPALGRAVVIGDSVAASAALRRSLVTELTCVVSILALVAWLGTLSPPTSM
ncbi:MAG: copper homeostasis membrane protein CopD [Sphingomonas sp.]|uniref:copper homeostasis membrane protein CopD n=1 Tax=Sphingomonas sp. TaxID=28214 RepID=UPI003F3CD8F1